MTELAKKVTLTQAIVSMRELFPSEYSFYPRSWILPAQLKEFSDYCLNFEETNNKCFIVKPDDGRKFFLNLKINFSLGANLNEKR